MRRAARYGLPIAAVLLAGVLPSTAFSPGRLDSEKMTQEEYFSALDMLISSAVLEEANRAGVEIPQTSRLTELGDVARELPAAYAERLVSRDATGQPILIVTTPVMRLISAGSDLQPDIDYGKPGVRELGRAIWKNYRDDIVVAPAENLILTPGIFRTERVERTTADLRSIGMALEAFSVDNNSYPGPTHGLAVVETLTEQLSPIYIHELPQRDAWGEPFLYWSDTQGYVLISMGADRRLDRPYRPREEEDGAVLNCAGATASDDQDLIFADGSLCQSPGGVQ